jgi:hypothetical protein
VAAWELLDDSDELETMDTRESSAVRTPSVFRFKAFLRRG